MDKLFQIDWNAVFVPTVSLLEIILRGTLIYLLLFAVLRLLRREAGGLGIADVLVIVLIADASQNAMASDYKSITEGGILVATIVFWDYALDFLAYHFPRFSTLSSPDATAADQRWPNAAQEHEAGNDHGGRTAWSVTPAGC
jgi:Predicted membrane protein